MQTVELRFEPTEPKVLQSGFEHKFDGSNFFGRFMRPRNWPAAILTKHAVLD